MAEQVCFKPQSEELYMHNQSTDTKQNFIADSRLTSTKMTQEQPRSTLTASSCVVQEIKRNEKLVSFQHMNLTENLGD